MTIDIQLLSFQNPYSRNKPDGTVLRSHVLGKIHSLCPNHQTTVANCTQLYNTVKILRMYYYVMQLLGTLKS